MDQSIDIVNHISTLLDSGEYKEALCVPNEEKYVNSFKANCWELISAIVSKIQDDTIIIKPSLYGTCEKLLSLVAHKAVAEEALLEFIEQLEVAANDAQFSIILMPLQELLKKLIVKRGRSLEWCLNSISTYIEKIPAPEHQLEGKERLLMDADTNIRRIIKIYSLLPSFYCPFIEELDKAHAKMRTKQIIASFLMSLLGKPLIYIDIDPECNANSEARLCCLTIIQDICTLEKDVLKFLVHVELCSKEILKTKSNRNPEDDIELSPYEHREKINMTTLSGLFYAVYSGHIDVPDMAIPQVYSFEYITHTLMLCVVHLLSFTEYGPLVKAVALCEIIFTHFPIDSPHDLLSASVHFDLCKSLMNVAIYSTFETIRKKCVTLITCHVNKFEYKGRCALIKYILKTSNHSGMIGYAITLYKNSLNEAFKEPALQECFTGTHLSNMVKLICQLPHGSESDIMELADQIITTLNFLRYLAIKDTHNATGIKYCFTYIENDYLEKLRTGLNMSKAHYEEKLKSLTEGKKLPEEEVNMSVCVGGDILNDIPTGNKTEIINSALNAFHLIEGLVARLSECINISKANSSNV